MIGETYERNGKASWDNDPDLGDVVEARFGCPNCGERHMNRLIWDDDDYVHCSKCGMVYDTAEKTC